MAVRVAMAMIIMRMIMTAIFIMLMIVVMTMIVPMMVVMMMSLVSGWRWRVGTAFRLEWRFDHGHFGAK